MTLLERKQVRRAAEIIANEPSDLFDTGQCHYWCCNVLLYLRLGHLRSDFRAIFHHPDVYDDIIFGRVIPENQLARSIALLLFAELSESEMP